MDNPARQLLGEDDKGLGQLPKLGKSSMTALQYIGKSKG